MIDRHIRVMIPLLHTKTARSLTQISINIKYVVYTATKTINKNIYNVKRFVKYHTFPN